MRAIIVDKDPFRRRVSRAALKFYNPMMQIAEVDRIWVAKHEYGYTFAPNFIIIDMELSGAKGYIENLLQNNISTIPQIYAYEGLNKKGVCQSLMTDRNSQCIVTVEWPQNNQTFYEIIREGYKWRGNNLQNTPNN